MGTKFFTAGVMSSHAPVGTLYTWLITLSLLALVGFATSRWIIPYLLRRLVSNFRVRSISARSIRGLFLKRGYLTINLERIGISFHSPTDSSARHVHVQVQGLVIHVTNLANSPPSRDPMPKADPRRRYSLDIAPPLAILADFLPSWLLWAVDAVMRPILRWLFVGATRTFIRILPSLSQIVDIEIDNITVVFEDLANAHINMRGVTLATRAVFSQLADINTRLSEEAKVAETISEHKQLSRAAVDWRNRLALSSRRTWRRAWSITQGSASISLKLQGITVSDNPWQRSPPQRMSTATTSSAHLSAPQSPSAMSSASASNRHVDVDFSPGIVFAVASPTLFQFSIDFTTTALKGESLIANLDIPEIFVSFQAFNSMWVKIRALRTRRRRHEAEADRTRIKPWIVKNLKTRALRYQKVGPEADDRRPTTFQTATHSRFESFLRILLSAELRLSSLTIVHEIGSDIEPSGAAALKCETRGFFIKVKPSRPGDNEMHRRWLGKPSQFRPKLEAQVLSLSMGMSALIVSRMGRGPVAEKHALLIVGESGIDVAATQIPGASLAPASCLGADPNASVLICETRVQSVRVSEQLDMLHQSLNLLSRKRRGSLPTKPPQYRQIPTIILDAQFSDIRLRLWNDGHVSPPEIERFYVEYAADYLGVMLSSSFVEPAFRAKTGHDAASINVAPLKLELHGNAHITPSTVRLEIVGGVQGNGDYVDDVFDDSMSANSFAGVRARSPSLSSPSLGTPEPLHSYTIARLDAIEASVQGQAPAIESSPHDRYFTRDNALVEFKLRMEYFLVDLRDLRIAMPLERLCCGLRTLPKHAESDTQQTQSNKQSLLSRLPHGISVYAWVGSVHAAVAGADVNPKAPPDLSRGMALSSSLVFEYCYLIAPQHTSISQRDRPKFGSMNAAAREELTLGPTTYEQASAFAHESRTDVTRSALCRIAARDAKVWVVSASCGHNADFPRIEDEAHSAAAYKHHPDNRVALEVPQLHMRGFLTQWKDPTIEGLLQDRLNLSFEVTRLYWRFHMLHAYCFLLACNRLRRLLQAPGVEANPRANIAPSILSLFVQIRIDDMHGMAVLASAEKLYLRSTRLNLNHSAGETTLRGGDIMAWVPCVRPGSNGSWEELGRIIGWSATVTVPFTRPVTISDLVLSIHSNAIRLRLPHNYVLNELVQDISVAYKAIRHLRHRVAAGSHQDMGTPTPEPPKRLPSVVIKVEYLVLELEDDPLEAQLNLNWRIGLEEQQARMERAAAFDAKVAVIRNSEVGRAANTSTRGGGGFDWKFDSHHSVDTDEAWQRLQHFTSQSWVKRIRGAMGEQERRETVFLAPLRQSASRVPSWTTIDVRPVAKRTPLLRVHLRETEILLTPPRFDYGQGLQAFMADLGSGLPSSTTFELLVPTHICWVAKELRISMRDYPLPVFNVPAHRDRSHHAWVFDTDLVIAEELGPPSSITLNPCTITHAENGVPEYELLVPKAIMPMKTYAEPTIEVNSSNATDFSWGVSLMPAVADVTRAMDRVTNPTKDRSPVIGFWDKLRLAVHWRLKASFANDVHIHLKGSRDPHMLSGQGAGFALEWKGNPKFTIGHSPEDKELLQLRSKQMYLTIPDLRRFDRTNRAGSDSEDDNSDPSILDHLSRSRRGKTVAKFEDEVRMGLGFVFEGEALAQGKSQGHSNSTRLFSFKPHFEVALRDPDGVDVGDDSYAGFRSRYIHLSVSLRSVRGGSGAPNKGEESHMLGANRFYLSPRTFAHFWTWWGLFNHPLSLPIRHGPLFPGIKDPSPKFSDNLMTIKYQVVLAPVFLAHIYHQDSRAGWKEGSTTCVGIKIQTEALQADLHQREQSISEYDPKSQRTKTTVHKRFHSAEVVLKSSELRAVRSLFLEPQKALFSTSTAYDEPDAPGLPDCDAEPQESEWLDFDDFTEMDWALSDVQPRIWLIPCGFVPRFTYLKRVPLSGPNSETSKFGNEDTHNCLQGREDSVQSIQKQFAEDRLAVLREELYNSNGARSGIDPVSHDSDHHDEELRQRILLLEEYISQFNSAQPQNEEAREHAQEADPTFTQQDYYMTLDENPVSGHWEAFHNVYQIHCPKIILSNTTRDILLDYYYSSRQVRGLEYQMAARAVQFIREQAMRTKPLEHIANAKTARSTATHVAGKALRKIIPGDHASSGKPQGAHHQTADMRGKENARSGLSDEAVVKNGHFMVLLKPQVALRSENGLISDLVAVANTVSLHNYLIMDPNHLDDPVHGVMMHRNFIKLNRLQVFAPNRKIVAAIDKPHDVPLEILVDYHCKHGGFTRLLPQADAKVHFDKFNRLRLRGESTTNLVAGTGDMSDHLRTQTDRITVNIPRFSVAANSADFAAIYDVITDLLLYHDPAQQQHNEALEKFVYLFDFRDRHPAADVVTKMQHRIRQLHRAASNYDLDAHRLSDDQKLEFLGVKSQIFMLSRELNLIFESIARAQARQTDMEGNDVFAVRLDAISSDLSWHALDEHNMPISKLSIRDTQYTWISKNDGSMSNSLTIGDMQALDGSPNAVFPEMLVKLELPGHSNEAFMQADWDALPAVGGISIIETFDLRLHPLRLQIERSMGRRVMKYIFSGDLETHRALDHREIGGHHKESPPSRPRVSMDSTPIPTPSTLQRPHTIARSSSFQNLRAAGTSLPQPPPRKLKRMPSSDQLVSRGEELRRPRDATNAVDMEIEEMRARATRNRAFLQIQVSSLTCVLSYKRDTPLTLTTVPDLDNFKFKTPQFQYHNQIWSFEEAVNAMKRDFYREVWRQKGVLIRELAVKAKFITPRKFLPSASESGPSSSTASLGSGRSGRKRWKHIFRRPTPSPAPPLHIPEPPSRIVKVDDPLVSSPSSDSFPSSANTTEYGNLSSRQSSSLSSPPRARTSSAPNAKTTVKEPSH